MSQGILEAIDLESYRNEAREAIAIKLEDSDKEVEPVPAGKVGHIVQPEMDLLSTILSEFNDLFGNINWNDADNVSGRCNRSLFQSCLIIWSFLSSSKTIPRLRSGSRIWYLTLHTTRMGSRMKLFKSR